MPVTQQNWHFWVKYVEIGSLKYYHRPVVRLYSSLQNLSRRYYLYWKLGRNLKSRSRHGMFETPRLPLISCSQSGWQNLRLDTLISKVTIESSDTLLQNSVAYEVVDTSSYVMYSAIDVQQWHFCSSCKRWKLLIPKKVLRLKEDGFTILGQTYDSVSLCYLVAFCNLARYV